MEFKYFTSRLELSTIISKKLLSSRLELSNISKNKSSTLKTLGFGLSMFEFFMSTFYEKFYVVYVYSKIFGSLW